MNSESSIGVPSLTSPSSMATKAGNCRSLRHTSLTAMVLCSSLPRMRTTGSVLNPKTSCAYFKPRSDRSTAQLSVHLVIHELYLRHQRCHRGAQGPGPRFPVGWHGEGA